MSRKSAACLQAWHEKCASPPTQLQSRNKPAVVLKRMPRWRNHRQTRCPKLPAWSAVRPPRYRWVQRGQEKLLVWQWYDNLIITWAIRVFCFGHTGSHQCTVYGMLTKKRCTYGIFPIFFYNFNAVRQRSLSFLMLVEKIWRHGWKRISAKAFFDLHPRALIFL